MDKIPEERALFVKSKRLVLLPFLPRDYHCASEIMSLIVHSLTNHLFSAALVLLMTEGTIFYGSRMLLLVNVMYIYNALSSMKLFPVVDLYDLPLCFSGRHRCILKMGPSSIWP